MKENKFLRQAENMMRYYTNTSFKFPEDLQKRAEENDVVLKKVERALENENLS